jgi:hypothetical protein
MSEVENRRWAVELATSNANRLQAIGHEVTMEMVETWARRFACFASTGGFEEHPPGRIHIRDNKFSNVAGDDPAKPPLTHSIGWLE